MKFRFEVTFPNAVTGKAVTEEFTGTLGDALKRFRGYPYATIKLAGIFVASQDVTVNNGEWRYTDFAKRVSPIMGIFTGEMETLVSKMHDVLIREQALTLGRTKREQQLSEIGDCLDGLREMVKNLQTVQDMMNELAED